MPLAMSQFDGAPVATDAQRAVALEYTEGELLKLRDLVRRLDLPVTAIEIAAEIYFGRVESVVATEHYKTQSRIDQKVKKLTELRLDTDPNELRKARMQLGRSDMMPGIAGNLQGEIIDTDLYALSEAELDAQIAKLSASVANTK
jgi:hypothetical protein